MTDSNKPEWFEIAENDEPSVPRKSSKRLPSAAVIAAALILGVGAIVAQTQEEPPANAVETTSNQTVASDSKATTTPTESVTPAAGSAANESVAPAKTTIVTASAKPSTTSTGLQNPSIATLPTNGGDDEGEEHSRHGKHHDDEDEGDDD